MNNMAILINPMKSFITLFFLISLLGSCKGRLYSYRKTVKTKDPITKNEVIHEPKVYMNIRNVKPSPSKSKMVKSDSDIQHIKVNTNTVYDTTKPLPTNPSKTTSPASVSSGSMPR
jgi:hypothetical protein